jgi:hypothetical protein
MGTNDQATFCLTEFETKKWAIFMFRANKIFHYTMKNQGGNQYDMTFFQKKIY